MPANFITRLFSWNAITRFFLAAPDQDYRGEPSEENDKLVEKVMNCAAIGAIALFLFATFML